MRTPDMLHSTTRWAQHELQDFGMPYMVMLPLMEIQDWNAHPVYQGAKLSGVGKVVRVLGAECLPCASRKRDVRRVAFCLCTWM